MKHVDIKKILNDEELIGELIPVCGWVRNIRKFKNMCFVEINDGTSFKNLQLVIDKASPELAEFFDSLNIGSSIVVNGIVVSSLNEHQNVELEIKGAQLMCGCPKEYPIQRKKQSLEYLRDYPHLRGRTNTFNAVFRVRSVLSKAIHDYFQENNFACVQTPIITGSNCEGAGEMFQVTTLDLEQVSKEDYDPNLCQKDFFGKKVSLTVSGQLEAEAMACCLGKVYTFGPSFRAEDSNTKRHAAEFWIIEPEVAFADLNDIMLIVNDIVKYLLKRVLAECPDEIRFFTDYVDKGLYDRLMSVIDNDFVNLEYSDAIKILQESGIDFDFPVYWGCDLKSEHIRYLTDVVYQKPVYILNYPKDLKPFYIKANEDGKTVASADLYFPGIGDIIGACQKEDNFELLNNRIKELNMTEEDYGWYMDLRKYGTVPHSGFGMGLERLVMYITGIDNIRDTMCFPRVKCRRLKI